MTNVCRVDGSIPIKTVNICVSLAAANGATIAPFWVWSHGALRQRQYNLANSIVFR